MTHAKLIDPEAKEICCGSTGEGKVLSTKDPWDSPTSEQVGEESG
jgi:hypothetical protein